MPLSPILFALAAHARGPCLTPSMRGAAGIVAGFGDIRPNDVGSVDSAKYPIRVHWRRPEDEARASTVLLAAAETSWEAEIVQMGWPVPPSDAGLGGNDNYDIYFTNEGTFGGAYAFGWGDDAVLGDDWYSNPSFVAIDDRFIPDEYLLGYVAHELNHASQYAIDAVEQTSFVWESTSEAIATLIDDPLDLYLAEIVDFQEFPFLSLLFNGYSDEVYAYDDYSYYEYGGWIFGRFLEERYGTGDGTQLLALWEALAQPTRTDEPDFVDAIAAMDPETHDAAAVYAEFAEWRMFAGSDDDGAHEATAHLWPDDAIPPAEETIPLAEVDGYAASPLREPYELGTTFYEIDLTDGTDQILHVEVEGDAQARWGLGWGVWQESGPAVAGSAVAAAGEVLAVDIPLAGGTKAKLGVTNGGRPDLNAETSQLPRRDFTITLSLADPPDPTTDPTTTDTDPRGTGGEGEGGGGSSTCGCASGPTAGWSGLLILPAIVARRRRR